jgi:hypothetical protein
MLAAPFGGGQQKGGRLWLFVKSWNGTSCRELEP